MKFNKTIIFKYFFIIINSAAIGFLIFSALSYKSLLGTGDIKGFLTIVFVCIPLTLCAVGLWLNSQTIRWLALIANLIPFCLFMLIVVPLMLGAAGGGGIIGALLAIPVVLLIGLNILASWNIGGKLKIKPLCTWTDKA